MLSIQINLEKKAKQKKETGVTLLNFTTYYRAKEMKTVCIGLVDSEVNGINLRVYKETFTSTVKWFSTKCQDLEKEKRAFHQMLLR